MNKHQIARVVIVIFLFLPWRVEGLDLDHLSQEVVTTYLHQASNNEGTSFEKEKSYGLAMALGFSPITGDGLYYTGHPVQGTLDLLLGFVGGLLLVPSLGRVIN